MAEAIGFVVAEFRLHIAPKLQKITDKEQGYSSGPIFRSEPKLAYVDNNGTGGQGEKSGEVLKKYTYEWAVYRMQELEDQGVADPVAYLNNEMTDWWLAPNGMMEREADFEGIALAIEERWHN